NLPAEDKLAEPYFAMLWDGDIPRLRETNDQGALAEVTVIAGAVDGAAPPDPPPSSWASRPDSDLAIWHLRLEPGADWRMPAAAGPDTVRTLYVFEGDGVTVDGATVDGYHAAVLRADREAHIASDGGAECLVLQGRPIAEPVAQYGPFVMNTEDEIRQAFSDYRATQFGGWPWPSDEPVNAPDEGRFARRPDGSLER